MNSKLQIKEKIQKLLSAIPADEATAALKEILKERTSEHQSTCKERDGLIQGLQLENLALKGALREGDRLLQLCVALLQQERIPIPFEIAQHMGASVSIPQKRRGVKCS